MGIEADSADKIDEVEENLAVEMDMEEVKVNLAVELEASQDKVMTCTLDNRAIHGA